MPFDVFVLVGVLCLLNLAMWSITVWWERRKQQSLWREWRDAQQARLEACFSDRASAVWHEPHEAVEKTDAIAGFKTHNRRLRRSTTRGFETA